MSSVPPPPPQGPPPYPPGYPPGQPGAGGPPGWFTYAYAPAPPAERRHLSYGQFLGRLATVVVLAPLAFVLPFVGLFLMIAVLGAALGGATVTTDLGEVGATEHIAGEEGAQRVVLVVDVDGPIIDEGSGSLFGGAVTGGYDLKDTLVAAAAEPDVRAVVLRVSSPGGTIPGSEAIAAGVEAVKKAGKPVVAHVTGLAASGGVWAMVPADEIIADEGSLVGSIGVLFGPLSEFRDVVAIDGGLFGTGVETTGGITQTFITAGRGKDVGNPFRPLTDDERAMLQRAVDLSYERFVAHVAASRPGLTEAEIRQELGAGIFDAVDARDAGLIDGIGPREDAYERAAELANLAPGAYDVRATTLDLGFFGSLFARAGLERRVDAPAADLTSLCGPEAGSVAYAGDLAGLCASTRG
jgi:protease-4